MEGNIFGTDGIRGRTNTYPIDPETILKIALSTGHVIGKDINFPKAVSYTHLTLPTNTVV